MAAISQHDELMRIVLPPDQSFGLGFISNLFISCIPTKIQNMEQLSNSIKPTSLLIPKQNFMRTHCLGEDKSSHRTSDIYIT